MPNRRLSPDEALIALIIAAMESSGHVAPVEAARAAELVRLMPQLRKHSRPVINRLIERMKAYVRDHDNTAIIDAVAEAIPPDDRAAAVMTVIAVLMSDHRLQRAEAAFLLKLSDALPYVTPPRRGAPGRGVRQSLPASPAPGAPRRRDHT
jgi:uncharacterized tellurite resistance protein B-like protein